MSSINCFAVIHKCIFACLSLTLIDLLLNVRCMYMYPGIGNELLEPVCVYEISRYSILFIMCQIGPQRKM